MSQLNVLFPLLALTSNRTSLCVGSNLKTPEGRAFRPIHFCDFSPAGGTWMIFTT